MFAIFPLLLMRAQNKKDMKYFIKPGLLICFTILSIAAFSQEKTTREPGNFSELNVTGEIRVELYPSEKPYIEIISEGISPGDIATEIKGNKLDVKMKTSIPKNARFTIMVYHTGLEKIEVQSRSLVTGADVFKAENILFDATTGGKIELEVDIENLEANVRQGAIIVLNGEVEKQEIKVSTGGTYSAYDLEARDSYVKAVTGGKAKVTAHRVIDAQSNSKAFIGYKGNPVSSNVNTSLGGEVMKISD
jgi:hypothetical protein